MRIVLCPAFSLCDIGPSADKGQPFGQCVDVTGGAIYVFYVPCDPVFGQFAALVKMRENLPKEGGVLGGGDGAEVGHAADIPKKAHRGGIGGAGARLGFGGQCFQRAEVIGFAGFDQKLVLRAFLQ